MNRLLSLAVLACGVVLISIGISSSNSAASGVSRLLTGSPTDKTFWLIIGGVIATAFGAAGLMRGSKSS